MRFGTVLTRTAPALAIGATLALTATSPASASNSGWMYSQDTPSGAKGQFKSSGDVTTACDIRTDGYKALVQIITNDGWDSLVYQMVDNRNNGKCTSVSAAKYDLREGRTYKIRVCKVKVGTRPLDCSSMRTFTA